MGRTEIDKKLLVTKGIATRSKDAASSYMAALFLFDFNYLSF